MYYDENDDNYYYYNIVIWHWDKPQVFGRQKFYH